MKRILFLLMVVLTLSSFVYTADAKSKRHHRSTPKIEAVAAGTVRTTKATYYGNNYKSSRHTASGKPFDMYAMTCACNVYPFGTKLKVKNVANDKEVVVVVTDRGGMKNGAVDLTYGAFKKIAKPSTGRITVEVTVLA